MKRMTHAARQLLLETLLATHGPVVTSRQVAALLPDTDAQAIRRHIATMIRDGWLVPVRAGLYQIGEVGSFGQLSLSQLTVAQLLLPGGYVSLEAALQHHGLFDQGLERITSVALKQRRTTRVAGINYTFIKTSPTYFFGYRETIRDGDRVRVATAEKALLDMLQFRRSEHTVDVVLECLTTSAHQLDLPVLADWALRLPAAVQRSIGYLLERASLAVSGSLLQSAQGSTGATRLTKGATLYHHRWRIYVEPDAERVGEAE